jgi:hypothetical protein
MLPRREHGTRADDPRLLKTAGETTVRASTRWSRASETYEEERQRDRSPALRLPAQFTSESY